MRQSPLLGEMRIKSALFTPGKTIKLCFGGLSLDFFLTLLLWFSHCSRPSCTELHSYFYVPVSKPTHSVLNFHFAPLLRLLFITLIKQSSPTQSKPFHLSPASTDRGETCGFIFTPNSLPVAAFTSERSRQQTPWGCHASGRTPTRLAEVLPLLRLRGNCSTNHNDCRRMWRRRQAMTISERVAMATDAPQLAEDEIGFN